MTTNVESYISSLEEHIKVADQYVSELKNKRPMWPKDKNAIKYWTAYKAGIEHALSLLDYYGVEEESE